MRERHRAGKQALHLTAANMSEGDQTLSIERNGEREEHIRQPTRTDDDMDPIPSTFRRLLPELESPQVSLEAGGCQQQAQDRKEAKKILMAAR